MGVRLEPSDEYMHELGPESNFNESMYINCFDPREAFKNNPFAEAEVHLTFSGQGRPSMFGGEPDQPHERPGEEFAKGHYEQLVAGKGTMRVGNEEWALDGFGLRDHSWGPRYWQAPWYYRWLTAGFSEDLGFMCSRVARRDGLGTRGGFVWDNGQMHFCDYAEVSTESVGDESYHDKISGLLRSSRSGKEWHFTGQSMSLIPLRNRRQDPEGNWLVTRISEAMTRWELERGEGLENAVGYGMSEYLDQIIDGQPVGTAE